MPLISSGGISVGLAKRKVFVLRAKQEETVEPQKSCKRVLSELEQQQMEPGGSRNGVPPIDVFFLEGFCEGLRKFSV